MTMRVAFKDGCIKEHPLPSLQGVYDALRIKREAQEACKQLGYTPSDEVSINLLIKQVVVWDQH